jgi:hypothetical protein
MPNGGLFKLISNDGVQDKLLMATSYLSHRLKNIEKINRTNTLRNPKNSNYLDLDKSWIPTINMISKSHVIFTNGSFKPFVATGFEYNKITGSAVFGNSTKFTLPQFGDFVNDTVLHIKLTGLSAKSPEDRVRYVALLGHKLISEVSFTINGNPLDSYTTDDYNAFYQFHVPPAKKTGWLRNVGQEIPIQAHLTADPTLDLHREYRWFGDGNQTFKQSHDEVELWIPLLFWFREVHNSLPNIAIPHGQTDIVVKFAPVNEIVGYADYGGGGDYNEPKISLCELYINNIFMNPDIANIFMTKFGFSLIRVHTRHMMRLSTHDGNIFLNNLKWPTECLYVAFRPQINKTLSQEWYLSSTLEAHDIKVPVVARNQLLQTVGTCETILPLSTNTAIIYHTDGPALLNTTDVYKDYDFIITGGTGYSATDIATNRYTIIAFNAVNDRITIKGVWNNGIIPDGTTTFELFTPQVAINVARYFKEVPTIDTIELKAHGIVIYCESSESFYNSYLPYRYGNNMNCPQDRGWYMINFNFYPGEHQPSGHINLSRSREFYLNYKSTNNGRISDDNRVDLICLADAINFLLVKDGSAVLRYAT